MSTLPDLERELRAAHARHYGNVRRLRPARWLGAAAAVAAAALAALIVVLPGGERALERPATVARAGDPPPPPAGLEDTPVAVSGLRAEEFATSLERAGWTVRGVVPAAPDPPGGALIATQVFYERSAGRAVAVRVSEALGMGAHPSGSDLAPTGGVTIHLGGEAERLLPPGDPVPAERLAELRSHHKVPDNARIFHEARGLGGEFDWVIWASGQEICLDFGDRTTCDHYETVMQRGVIETSRPDADTVRFLGILAPGIRRVDVLDATNGGNVVASVETRERILFLEAPARSAVLLEFVSSDFSAQVPVRP